MNNTPGCLLIFTFCNIFFFLLNVYTAASSPFHSMIFTFVCLDFVQTPKVIIVRLIGSWPVEQQELLSQTNTHNHNLISYETLGKTEKKTLLFYTGKIRYLFFYSLECIGITFVPFFLTVYTGQENKKKQKTKKRPFMRHNQTWTLFNITHFFFLA